MATVDFYSFEEMEYIYFEDDGITIDEIKPNCPKKIKASIEAKRKLIEGEDDMFSFLDSIIVDK